MKSFIEAQFGYYTLNWMMVEDDERSLRILSCKINTSFNDLLEKDKCVCIHYKSIQSLAIELIKVKENLFNATISDIFPTGVLNYNLRSQTDFFRNTLITQNML